LLDDHRIDLVLLNEQAEAALRIGDHPFITTLWDLDHRDHPEFPEWFVNRTFERTERSLAVTLTRAIAVIASSPSVARRISSLYRVDPHRIIELPLLPAIAVRRHAAGHGTATTEGVRRKYALPAVYVFYPAFFSFYKNHLYLLEGLVELERQYGIALDAVFCGGGEPEEREYVERQAAALGLTARVRFIGYVPEEEVPALYEGALALVIPSYFGPTNLPPLEAVTLGCPVIYSDLPDFRELIGDAALYCDLTDPASLAGHLAGLIQDPALRAHLLEAGRARAADLARIDYGARLEQVFDEFAHLRRRWAWPNKLG
jgi:glycosyltransferase involved in cell wall biosynthesis